MDTYQGYQPLINVRSMTGLPGGALDTPEFNVSRLWYIFDGGRLTAPQLRSAFIRYHGDKGSKTQQIIKAAGTTGVVSRGPRSLREAFAPRSLFPLS